jgi:hypothetical protein
MEKILFESLHEFRLNEAPEGEVATAPNVPAKTEHPAKTLKGMLNMPYDKFVALLKQSAADPKIERVMNLGRKDGLPSDEMVRVTAASYPAYKLRPTQSQIGLGDSLGWLAKNRPDDAAKTIAGDTSGFDNARILTANGTYILDGHHRWSQVMMFNPKAEIPAINLEIPGFKDPKQILKIVQLAIAATYKTVPSSTANSPTDIFNENVMSEAKIRAALPEIMGSSMTEVARVAYSKKYKKQFTADDVYNLMTKNAQFIKKYKPANAPPRTEMPQPSDAAAEVGMDKGGVKGIPTDFVATLKSGKLNYKAPLIANHASANSKTNSTNSKTNTAAVPQ